MRSISSSIVLLSGCFLMFASYAVDNRPDAPKMVIGLMGFAVGLIGLLGWAIAYFRDGGRN